MNDGRRRISAQIGRKPAAKVHHATRLADRIGHPLNQFVTINYSKTACPPDQATAAFRDLLSNWFARWLRRHPKNRNRWRPAYVYTFEAAGDQIAVHRLVHVPKGLIREFSRLVPEWIAATVRPDRKPCGNQAPAYLQLGGGQALHPQGHGSTFCPAMEIPIFVARCNRGSAQWLQPEPWSRSKAGNGLPPPTLSGGKLVGRVVDVRLRPHAYGQAMWSRIIQAEAQPFNSRGQAGLSHHQTRKNQGFAQPRGSSARSEDHSGKPRCSDHLLEKRECSRPQEMLPRG